MKIRLGILYLSVSVFLWLECTGDSGGLTGTESTNGRVTASVSVPDTLIYGSAPEGTQIILNSSDYNPVMNEGYSDTVHSVINGSFEFQGMDSGIYNLIATDTPESSRVFLEGLLCIPGEEGVKGHKGDTGYLADLYYVEGSVEPGPSDTSSLYVYAQGSPFFSRVDDKGGFRLRSMPKGDYNLILYTKRDSMSVTGPSLSEEDSIGVSISDSSITGVKFQNQ